MITYQTSSPVIFGMSVTKEELKHLKDLPHGEKLDQWYMISGEWSDGAAYALAKEIGLDVCRRF